MIYITNILPFIIIAASWITHCIMQIRWKKHNKRFTAFLQENYDALLRGCTCEFDGVEYNRETRITRFYCCMSVLFLTYYEQSSYVPTEDSAKTKALCILLSLTGGWWGFPWGPIKTIQAVYKNCTAGSITLYDLCLSMISAQDIRR